MDLHIVHTTSAQIEPPTAKIFNPPDFAPKTMHENVVESLPSIVNPTVDCAKFFEAEKGQENVVDTHGGVELPMVVVAAEIVMDVHGGVGLPMVGVGQLVRPPECVSKELEDGCCRGLSLLCFLLIAFDKCHVTIMSHRNWSRIDLRGSVGIIEANTPRDIFSRRRRYLLLLVVLHCLLIFYRVVRHIDFL